MLSPDGSPVHALLDQLGTQRVFHYRNSALGLKAFLVVDSLVLGPAAGGVRTMAYASEGAALLDAARLARAMTIKCSLAGLDAGGAKMVVMDHPSLDRQAAFRWLGRELARIDFFHTAGDLGTRAEDLVAMAAGCERVRTNEAGLSAAVGAGVSACVAALARHRGRPMAGLRVGVQGVGSVGAEVARELAQRGCRLVLSDRETTRAHRLAVELGAETTHPDDILSSDVDIVSPCAGGGLITCERVSRMKAWAVCGPANNELADRAAARAMHARGVLHVPSSIAGAGAVILGLCGTADDGLTLAQRVFGGDADALIGALGHTAARLIDASEQQGELPEVLAERWAMARIAAGRVAGDVP